MEINETLDGLLNIINQNLIAPKPLIDMANTDARYLKDLKINIGNSLSYESLTQKESTLLALGIAINEKSQELELALKEKAINFGVNSEEISETYACVSLLNVNNVFYRFRHFTKKDFYQK